MASVPVGNLVVSGVLVLSEGMPVGSVLPSGRRADHRCVAAKGDQDVHARVLADRVDEGRHRRLVLRRIGEPAHGLEAVHRERHANEVRLPPGDQAAHHGLLERLGVGEIERVVVSAEEDVIHVHAAAHPLHSGRAGRHQDLVAFRVEPAGRVSAIRPGNGRVRYRRDGRAPVVATRRRVFAWNDGPAVVGARGPGVVLLGLRRLAGRPPVRLIPIRRRTAGDGEDACARDEGISHRSSPIEGGPESHVRRTTDRARPLLGGTLSLIRR